MNEMRERLKQLLQEAEGQAAYYDGDDAYGGAADYLLDNGVIVPLVTLGQTVWSVTNGYDHAVEGKIYEYVSRSTGVDSIYFSRNGYLVGCTVEDAIGKTVFLTREAAEAALKARDKQ